MQQPARLGIITKPNEPRAGELAARIAAWAAEHQINLFVNDRVKDLPPGTFSASAREIVDNCDLLIALGGDGTMISTARLVAGRGTPVLGINLGTLGYLTEFAIDEAIPALEYAVRESRGPVQAISSIEPTNRLSDRSFEMRAPRAARLSVVSRDQNQALAVLRYPVVVRVKNVPPKLVAK